MARFKKKKNLHFKIGLKFSIYISNQDNQRENDHFGCFSTHFFFSKYQNSPLVPFTLMIHDGMVALVEGGGEVMEVKLAVDMVLEDNDGGAKGATPLSRRNGGHGSRRIWR